MWRYGRAGDGPAFVVCEAIAGAARPGLSGEWHVGALGRVAGVERCGDTDARATAPDRSWSATPSLVVVLRARGTMAGAADSADGTNLRSHEEGPWHSPPRQRPAPPIGPHERRCVSLRLCHPQAVAATRLWCAKAPLRAVTGIRAPASPHPNFFLHPSCTRSPPKPYSCCAVLRTWSPQGPVALFTKNTRAPRCDNIERPEGMNDASTSPPNARRMCRASPS